MHFYIQWRSVATAYIFGNEEGKPPNLYCTLHISWTFLQDIPEETVANSSDMVD